MVNLTPEYWNNFKPDGLLFEELVDCLLSAMYPGKQFFKTKKSHDGNRDFEYTAPLLEGAESKIWMECKYHTNAALPIHDVSMTLLMAYIEGVSQILIFSYSRVTSTFFDYIAEYKARSAKEVIVYSDVYLEQLIFKYREEINFLRFFPQYRDCPQFPDSEKLLCKYVLKNSDSRFSNIYDEQAAVVSLNEEIYSSVYIINNSNKEKNVIIEVIQNKALKCFEMATDTVVHVKICCYSSVVIPINYRLSKYETDLQYPKIKITEIGKEPDIYRIKKKLQYRWLADTEIIGDSYKKIINNCKTYMNTLNQLSIITLIGSSGIGKSRIIKEVLFYAQKCHYKICYVDSDKDSVSAKFLIEKIVAILDELPLFDFDKKETILYLSQKNDMKSYAAHLLYDEVDIQNEKIQISKYLVELLRKETCVLALDNVQKYDELSLDILNLVLEYSNYEQMNSTLVICFNQDYVYSGTEADNLRKYLQYYANHNIKKYYYAEILGFEKEEAYEYIHACLNFDKSTDCRDNIPYSKTIKKIVDHFGVNPFFLKNVLLYLEQKKILQRSVTTNYYIADLDGFTNCMDSLPSTIEALISMREELFINHHSEVANFIPAYFRVMQFMTLTHHMPTILYQKIIKDISLIHKLENIGFLFIGRDKKIHYSHSVFERYFVNKYPAETIAEEDLKEFSFWAKNLAFKKELFFQIFWADYYLASLTEENFIEAINRVIKWDIDLEFSTIYLPIISRIINSEIFTISISMYLDLYWSLSNIMSQRKGIQSSWEYTKIVFDKLVRSPEIFSNDVSSLIRLIKEGILNLVNARILDEAQEKAFMLLNIYLKHFNNNENNKKNDLLDIYNCLIICDYHLDYLEEALQISNKCMQLIDCNDETYITVLRVRGDIYYHNSHAWKYKKEIGEWWHKAYYKYIEKHGTDIKTGVKSQLKIATYIKGMLADLITEDYHNAYIKVNFLSRCIDKTDMTYYEIYIRLAKVTYLLITTNKNQMEFKEIYDEVIMLLNQSTDICTLYGNVFSYINCFYLRAISQVFYGKFDFAYDNYLKVYFLLSKALKSERDYVAWNFFFIEMAMFLKVNGKKVPGNLLSSIKSDKLYEAVIHIMNMSQDDFEDFRENYNSLSPLHNSTNIISFPQI